MLDLNIVIVNYKNKDEVKAAVKTIAADLANSPINYQITVVDNSQNTDGIKDEIKLASAPVKYVDAGSNIGFGAGANLGLKSAPARYYLLLNPDTQVMANSRTMERMLKFMDENPKVGAAAPKLVYPDNVLQYSCYRFDRPAILIKPLKHINWEKKYQFVKKIVDRLEMREFEHNETRPVDWVMGAALILRAAAMPAVGWFDERYFMYFEDCDLCQTLWENGWSVYYLHDVAVVHAHERASASVPGAVVALVKNKLARVHLASWLKYLWKWRRLHKYYVKLS